MNIPNQQTLPPEHPDSAVSQMMGKVVCYANDGNNIPCEIYVPIDIENMRKQWKSEKKMGSDTPFEGGFLSYAGEYWTSEKARNHWTED